MAPSPAWAQSGATSTPFYIVSGVQAGFSLFLGMGAWLMSRTIAGVDAKIAGLETRAQHLEQRVVDTREDYARKAELDKLSALWREDLKALQDTWSTREERLTARMETVGREVHEVKGLLLKMAGGARTLP